MKHAQLAEGKCNARPLDQANAEDAMLLRDKAAVLPSPPAHHPSGRKKLGVPLEQEASLKINSLSDPFLPYLRREGRGSTLLAGLLPTQRLAICSDCCAHHVTTNSSGSSEAHGEKTQSLRSGLLCSRSGFAGQAEGVREVEGLTH